MEKRKTGGPSEILADKFADVVNNGINRESIAPLAKELKGRINLSHRGLTLSGSSIVELITAIAARINYRSREQLEIDFNNPKPSDLSREIVKHAARKSGGIGAAVGAVASIGTLAPISWVLLPAEVVIETLLIAAIELKMIAELHEASGLRLSLDRNVRAKELVETWSGQRNLTEGNLGKTSVASYGIKGQIRTALRRKFFSALARSTSTIIPLFVGATLGAWLNSRSINRLGKKLIRSLKKASA